MFHLRIIDLGKTINRLEQFHKRFQQGFRTKTRNVSHQALQYLQGKMLQKGRGNMSQYAKNVPGSDYQRIQNFISDSPWNERPIIEQIQKDVSKAIGDKNSGAIHIDESGFKKDGKNSVGVKRQYCGRLGKVENCQVGVFLGYTNGSYRTLIDERLYLPEDWANDYARRQLCGVPKDVKFKTKAELGLEMILDAKKRKVPFGWVGMDTFYGEQSWLLDELDNRRIIYVADIPCNTRVWLSPLSATEVPTRQGRRRRKSIWKHIASGASTPMRVDKLTEQLDQSEFHRIFLRKTERKELWCQIACLRVYPVRDGLPGKETWLIIRKDDGESRTKYQLSNAPINTSIKRLGQMSCSRYWMERAIEDAKGEAGLADYQVRSWTGWHHHMVMTLLAMLFILELQLEWGEKASMISVQDVKEVLEVILPKNEITEKEILDVIKQKHKARLSARMSHYRRNGFG